MTDLESLLDIGSRIFRPPVEGESMQDYRLLVANKMVEQDPIWAFEIEFLRNS